MPFSKIKIGNVIAGSATAPQINNILRDSNVSVY